MVYFLTYYSNMLNNKSKDILVPPNILAEEMCSALIVSESGDFVILFSPCRQLPLQCFKVDHQTFLKVISQFNS
jgi:hypothetical protein